MEQPLISIIIPVYNAEKYLVECVGSVIEQTYQNLEIILLNDGSTDATEELCRAYQKKDSRIAYYVHQNQGVGYTRNRGMDLAKGTYLLFVDGDDYMALDAVEKLYQVKERERSELVTARYEKADDAHRCLFVIEAEAGTYTFQEYLKVLDQFKIDPLIGGPINKLYDMAIIRENRIRFDETSSYAEDFIFNMRYIKFCKKISILREVLYTYRITPPNSLSKRKYDPGILIPRQRQMVQEYQLVLECVEGDYERQKLAFWYYLFLSDLRKTVENRKKSFGEKTAEIRQIFELVHFKQEFRAFKNETMSVKQRLIFQILLAGNTWKTYRLLCLILSIQYRIKKSRNEIV